MNLNGNSRTSFFYGYAIVLIAFVIQMITWGTLYSFGIFFKPVLSEFGWTRAVTSGAYSLCLVTTGSICIVAGRLNDRFGPRLILTGCGLFLGVGYLLMSQVNAIWQLYLFYGLLVGIGMGSVYVPLLSTVARWFVKGRGLMSGIALSGVGLGTLIMPLLANWLISNYGWRTSYIIVAIVVSVFTMLAAQFLKRDPSQLRLSSYSEGEVTQASIDAASPGLSPGQAVRTGQFWIICVMFLFLGVSIQTTIVHIVPHMTDLAVSADSAAVALSLVGGVSIAGRILMGNVADRVGNKLAAIMCMITILIALLCLLTSKQLWMFYLFAVVFGFAYGGLMTLISLLVAESFGLLSIGAILGFVTFGLTTGEATGPTLAGIIFDITKSYQPAFIVCAALSAMNVMLVFLLKPIPMKNGSG